MLIKNCITLSFFIKNNTDLKSYCFYNPTHFTGCTLHQNFRAVKFGEGTMQWFFFIALEIASCLYLVLLPWRFGVLLSQWNVKGLEINNFLIQWDFFYENDKVLKFLINNEQNFTVFWSSNFHLFLYILPLKCRVS